MSKCPGKDIAWFGPELSPGVRVGVRHDKDHNLEAGVLVTPKPGQPVPPGSELLKITPEEGQSYCHVESVYKSDEPSSGPAMVNSEAYRNNWTNIFGKQKVGKS